MSIWQRAPENSGAEPETGVRAAGGNLTGSAEFLHKEAEKELTGHTYVVVSKTEPMRSVRRFICSPVRRTRFCG